MAVEPLIMPKLGAYTEDVLLTEWLVEEGVQVTPGIVVFELETDKTTAEVAAETAGWLHQLVAAGEKVPIGARVGLIAATEEEYDAIAGAPVGEGQPDGGRMSDDADDHPFLGYIGHGGGTAVARAAGAAYEPPTDEPAASLGRPTQADEPTRDKAPPVSPRARALLAKLGLSLEQAGGITGTGKGGRILDRDVAAWAAARSSQQERTAPAGACELTVHSTVPLRGRRRTIADRMVSSLQTAAQLTSVLELDVKPLVDLRAQLNEAGATPRIGVTSIMVKLVASALRAHPILNSRVTETDVELLAQINVAVAVDTPDGLVAPVVAGADALSLEAINERISDLAARTRNGSLEPADVAGGTFTVSNGGIYPVDITTAILNPPQCGILWIGRIRDRPVVVGDGVVAVRPTLQACLTYDHRAVDGGPAAAFLASLEALVAGLPHIPILTAEHRRAMEIAPEIQLSLYRTMLTIRFFEQRVAREFRTGEIPGFVHMYVGQEAVAAGVCANLTDDDYVTSTHRGHGHCIAKGCDLDRMMAEIYGREDGLCKGRGGSMHIADFSKGMLGANAIVGGGIALATGAGLASSVRGSGQVAVAFFGDGAANQGVLHESLNLAAIWRLPVIYVCENNGFAESTPASYATSVPDMAARASGYGIPGVVTDGADVLEVYAAMREAVARARAGDGPTLLEAKTYRFMGHFEGDPERYRDDDERKQLRERDAIPSLREHLLEGGHATPDDLEVIQAKIEAAVDKAVEFARASPFPDPNDIAKYVYPEPVAHAEVV